MPTALEAGTRLTTPQRAKRRTSTPRRVAVREVESTRHEAEATDARTECEACGRTFLASVIVTPTRAELADWRQRDPDFRHWLRRMTEHHKYQLPAGCGHTDFRALYCPTCDDVFVRLVVFGGDGNIHPADAGGFVISDSEMVDRFLRNHPKAKEAIEAC